MKKLIFLLSFLLLVSCNTQKAAQKKLERIFKNHPELLYSDTSYTINTDTILVPVPSIRFKTVVEPADTIVIERDNLQIRIERTKEYVKVEGEVSRDSIYIYRTDTARVIRTQVVTKTVKVKHIPFWAKVLAFLVSFYILRYLIIENISKKFNLRQRFEQFKRYISGS